MITKLKLAKIIYEDNKLSIEDKIKYIKEIKSLSEVSWKTLAGAAVIGVGAGFVANTIAKNSDGIFGQESRKIQKMAAPMFIKCNKIKDKNTRTKCLIALGMKIQNLLKQSKSKCKQSKVPEKCMRLFDSEITAGSMHLSKLKNSLN